MLHVLNRIIPNSLFGRLISIFMIFTTSLLCITYIQVHKNGLSYITNQEQIRLDTITKIYGERVEKLINKGKANKDNLDKIFIYDNGILHNQQMYGSISIIDNVVLTNNGNLIVYGKTNAEHTGLESTVLITKVDGTPFGILTIQYNTITIKDAMSKMHKDMLLLITLILTSLLLGCVLIYVVLRPITNAIHYVSKIKTVTFVEIPDKSIIDSDSAILYSALTRLLNLINENTSIIDTRIEEKTQSLLKALQVATSANKAKSEFISSMNQELRNPLTAIIGFTDIIKEAELPNDIIEYIIKIRTMSNSLLRVLGDILDYTKMEVGDIKIKSKEFSILRIFCDIGDMYEHQVIDKGLMLNFIEPNTNVNLIGDSMRISQVLMHLVGNAIRFTKSGSITVTATAITEGCSVRVTFSVRDTGVGIANEYLAELLDDDTNFYINKTPKYGKSGLGLRLVKKIVKLLDGKIWADSMVNIGSVFYFSVLLQKQSYLDIKVCGILKNKKVLVIEPDIETQTSIISTLKAIHVEFDLVNTVDNAKTYLVSSIHSRTAYDVILFSNDALTILEELESDAILSKIKRPKTIRMLRGIPNKDKRCDNTISMPICTLRMIDALRFVFKPAVDEHVIKSKPNRMANVAKRLRGINVLSIDDNKTNQKLITMMLNSVGVIADATDDVKNVTKMLDEKRYDVILMDIQMPEIDGYTLTREIRKTNSNIPIIAVSAQTEQKDITLSFESGMNDHIEKPIISHKLFEKIIYWLDKNKSNQKKEIATPVLLQETTYINVKLGLSRVNGNKQEYICLLNTFLTNYQSINTTINMLYTTKNFDNIRTLLNNVVERSHVIGATELENNINTLLRDGLESNLSEYRLMVDDVIANIKNVVKDIENIINEDNGSSSHKTNKMIHYLDNNRGDAIFEFVKIKNYLLEIGTQEAVDSIETALNRFDFIEAKRIFVEVMGE